jgi:membrane associated rhomboid family serine protease
MLLLFAILVVIGFALRVMTPTERGRLLDALKARALRGKDEAIRRRAEPDPFRDVLQARTSLVLVVPALLALNALVFLGMLFGSGSFGDPETLVSWGANFGPRTTNGEWSRLITSLFVHVGLLHLLVNAAGLAQAGMIVERLLGHFALAAAYFAAGILAGLESLSSAPVGVHAGSSGAVFGVYGMLLAAVMWGMLKHQPPDLLQLPGLRELRQTMAPAENRDASTPETSERVDPANQPVTVPLKTLVQIAPAAVLFFLYNAADGLATAELAGLVAGFICGLVLARNAADAKPPLFEIGAAAAATAVIVVASALFLRGVADVRPELARVVALEDRTASTYEKAMTQFRNGSLSAPALAQVIDKSIVPELQAARARLKAINGVPQEHQPLVASAEEYFRLRDESWRIRAEGLHKRNLPTLQRAERPERAALEALERIRPVEQKPIEHKPAEQK